jgi:hypothetical protein
MGVDPSRINDTLGETLEETPMRTAAVIGLVSVAALCGCSKPAPAGAPEATKAAAPSGPGVAALLRPSRKAGLWRMKVSMSQGPGFSLNGEMCVDAKTAGADTFMGSPRGRAARDCDKTDFRPAPGGGFLFDSLCKVGDDRTITTHGLIKGDFQKTYSVDLTARTDPPVAGAPAEIRTRIEAEWAGPCPPDASPGRMRMRMGGLGAMGTR